MDARDRTDLIAIDNELLAVGLQTDDGALVYVQYPSVALFDEAVVNALARTARRSLPTPTCRPNRDSEPAIPTMPG